MYHTYLGDAYHLFLFIQDDFNQLKTEKKNFYLCRKKMAKKNKNRQDGFVYSTNPDYTPEDNPFGSLLNDQQINEQNQVIRIFLVRKKGNKEVTTIRGLEVDLDQLKSLGKMLKTKCGVGGTVKDGEILIQGNHREKVRQLLIAEGYSNTKLAGG